MKNKASACVQVCCCCCVFSNSVTVLRPVHMGDGCTPAASAATGMAPPATGGASSSATPSAAATAPACCSSHGACCCCRCCSRCRGRCNSGTVKHRHRVGDGGTANAALGQPVATGTASHKVATWSKDDLARSIHANAALVKLIVLVDRYLCSRVPTRGSGEQLLHRRAVSSMHTFVSCSSTGARGSLLHILAVRTAALGKVAAGW